MFESVVASVLNRVLGRYIDNLEGSQLSHVVLHGLKLKRDALDELDLPIEIVKGLVGEMRLEIPWANLKGRPVVITLDKIYIQATPVDRIDAERFTARQLRDKLERLATSELLRASAARVPISSDNQADSFATSLINKIVDNLQLSIKNIHIRLEDNARMLSMGVCLSHFRAFSVDEDGVERFITEPTTEIFKAAELSNLFVYSDSRKLFGLEQQLWETEMSALIQNPSEDPSVYILRPVSGIGTACIQRHITKGKPRVLAQLKLEEFAVSIGEDQLLNLLLTFQSFILLSRRQSYINSRPQDIIVQAPNEWLIFVLKTTLDRIKLENHRKSIDYVMERRKQRREYVELYKSKMTGRIGNLERTRIEELDCILDYQDIRMYRAIARRAAYQSKSSPQSPTESNKSSSSSWWSYAWWGGEKSSIEEPKTEEVEELLETIDYEEEEIVGVDDPVSVRSKVILALGKATLSLYDDGKNNVVDLLFHEMHTILTKRQKSNRVEVKLGDLKIREGISSAGFYQELLKSKATKYGQEIESVEHFIDLAFDTLQNSDCYSSSLTLKMKPLQIIVNHEAVRKLGKYVYAGERGKAIRSLFETAANNLTRLKAKTLANLQFALSQHQSTRLDVDIDAPILILPLSCDLDDLPLFILDLGSIKVNSNSIPVLKRRELVEKYKDYVLKGDADELFEVLYDQSLVSIKSAKVYFAKNIDQWTSCAKGADMPIQNMVLDQIDLDLTVGTSIVKHDEGLVGTKVHGNLPPFTLHFSDHKWRSFMALIDVLLGKGEHTASPKSVMSANNSEDDFFDAIDEPVSLTNLADGADWQRCKLSVLVSFEKVSGLFKKYDALDDSEQTTATVVAEKLGVRADIFEKSITVKVILEQFGLYDNRLHQDYDGPIVEGRAQLNDENGDSSFLQVIVDYVDNDHPLFFTKYEGVKINVGIVMSDVLLYLEPVNFFTHIRYIIETFADDDIEMLQRLSILNTEQPDLYIQDRSLVRVNASITEIAIALGRNTAYIGDFIASKAILKIDVDRSRDVIVRGSLLSIDILNAKPIESEVIGGRKFVSNEGDQNLAIFTYCTYPKNHDNINAHDSSLDLQAGSLRIAYMPVFLRQLLDFVNLIKGSVYIATRKAQNNDSKMKVSIELQSPVLELVREPKAGILRPLLVYLGNMKMHNVMEYPKSLQFIQIDGFRAVALIGPDLTPSTVLLDTSISLTMEQHVLALENKVPSNIVRGSIANLDLLFGRIEFNLFISRIYHFLDTISPAVEPWFNPPGAVKVVTTGKHINQDIFVEIEKATIHVLLGPSQSDSFADLTFDRLIVDLKMAADSSIDFKLTSHDVHLSDPRKPDAPFHMITPPLQLDSDTRLSLKYTRETDGAGDMRTKLQDVELIFALDYVFALKSFLVDNLPPRSDIAPYDPNAKPMFQEYQLDNLKLYLIENPESKSTEALRLTMDRLTFTSQNNSSLFCKNIIGAFINMDRPAGTELQLIEPLDIDCSIEYEKSNGVAIKTVYNLTIDQFVTRLSSEDFLFAKSVWSQFSTTLDWSLYLKDVGHEDIVVAYAVDAESLPKIGREKLLICCNLVRLVIIDDLSRVNLPLCDLSFEKVNCELLDWTSTSSVSATFNVVSNSFNLNNSHWEPFIEPTALQVVSKKTGSPARTDLVVSADKKVDIVVTHAFAGMLYNLMSKVNQGDNISMAQLRTADRQVSMPYRIYNYTGYPLAIWNDADHDPDLQTIQPDADLTWAFEDWRLSRRLLGNQTAKLSIQLLGSEWESVKGISIDKIGVYVYSLRPNIENITHKLTCEVILVGSIKHVFIRPSVVLKNRTKFPLQIISENTVDNQTAAVNIQPGGYAAFPVKYSHKCAFRLKPTDMEYDPSKAAVTVSRLVNHFGRKDDNEKESAKSKAITSVQVESVSSIPDIAPFYFLIYSKPLPIRSSRDYPVANLIIRAPIEVHNLLPRDIRFRMYDLDAKYDFGGSVGAGKMAPLHAIRSDHLVGISIEIVGTLWKSSEVASMNCADQHYHDDEVRLRTPAGQYLNLRMVLEEGRGRARTVKIYCPYVILNRTGLNLDIAETKGLDMVSGPSSPGSTSRNIFTSSLVDGKQSDPLLFSFSSGRSTRHRVRMRAEGSQWSESVSLDAVGTIAVVHMKSACNQKWYNLSVAPKLGNERYAMVKMIHIAPAYVVVNRLPMPIFIRGWAEDSGDSSVCQPSESMPFHFNPDAMKQIQLSFDDQKWASFLDFSSVGKIYCRIHDHSDVGKLLRVELSLESGTCFVFVEEAKSWPFVIENQSDFVVSFNQIGVELVRQLQPKTSINYAWDDPSSRQRTIEIDVYDRKKEINVNEIGTRAPFPFRLPDNTKCFLSINVVASGPVIKVIFGTAEASKKKDRRFLPRRSNTPTPTETSSPTLSTSALPDGDSTSEGFEVLEAVEEVSMVTVIRLPFVGISFVRKDNKELFYLSCRDLEVRLSRSNLYLTYGLQIKSIQLDNQMFDWQIPIIMFPAYTPLHGNAQQQSAQQQHQQLQNHLRVALIKSTDTSHGIDCYSYFGFLLQETIVELGTDVILRINDFLSFEQPKLIGSRNFTISAEELTVPDPPHRDPSKDSVYFELFQIHPIKLTVSSTRAEGFVDDSEDQGAFVNPFFAIQEAAASTLINFSQVPFTFNALILEHPIVSTSRLRQLIYNHYMSGFSGQLAKVLGFVDFLFNPVGLFNNLGSGVSDFFYEPYLGFVSDRPQDIGIGFLKGGFSLVRKTVFGLTDSFSKFTGSIGKGLSALTFDKSFQQRRRIDRARNRPRHALFGVVTGARQFVEGLAGGFGGLIEKPLEGAKEEGAEGFFKGVAIGIVGALSKPFVGAVDMVTSVTEGIRNSADPNVQDLQQVRLPRVIPYDGIVRKYKEREARGQFLMYNCVGDDLFKEYYMGHLEDEEGSALFITCRRVLAGRVQSGRIIWEAPFEIIYSIRTDSDAIIITLDTPDHKQRRIVCSRREVQEWFVERVNLAMTIYHEYSR